MHHLAQLNVAKMKFPYEDPRFSDFVNALDSVNATAAASPGFVWRLPEEDDAMATQVFGDDLLLINMSVWESIDQLKSFVSSQAHLEIMRRRSEWFHSQNAAYLVLWWIAPDHTPTIEEAQAKLDYLREHGPSERAFNFSASYPPPI
ncbi:MAG: DUF3291 domain-containing protein [Gammaproteobacteria bacterium]|nr:DUF3291 domain-containing protein [Gammaproteobacteria bacterium]